MGPTGVGKTDLAVELVSRLPLEIISVDSAMVYRRMDIGTGKPEPSVRAAAPHHLLDVREPHESYSAADFRSDALQAIAEIRSRGRIPFLVGGTGLYFRALHDGLSPLPSADPALRNRLAEQAAASDWAALHRRLEKVDPVTAARIHPRDAQRIQRGLEVFELTGRTMSELQRQPPMGDSSAETGRLGRVVSLALEPALRSRLHQRIQIRFERMLALGLLDEVRELRRDPRLSADLSSMRAVGYRQAWEHLAGVCAYPTMVERALAATRQLAKRQLTWIRTQTTARRFDAAHPRLPATVANYLSEVLASGR